MTGNDGAPIISVRGLNKFYGEFQALKNISLDVFPGGRVVVCGPSGSGKSTLIRCINRLEAHQGGEITAAGRRVHAQMKNIHLLRADIGMVFQNFNLFPHLTVTQNLTAGPVWALGTPEAEAQKTARLYLERVKIPEQAEKYPAQLSGGQQQRVALARALAISPALLLLDEPLSAIDAKVRQRLRREIKQLQRDFGVTTVMVTHDQEEALTMADRIAVINCGRIEQIGAPREIYDRPASAFVADFLGTMNFFDGVCAVPGTVRVGDCDFRCSDESGVCDGGEVTIAFRPEHIEWNSGGGGGNRLCCVAEGAEFLGAVTRIVLRADGVGKTFIAELPSALAAELMPAEGERVTVTAPAAELRVFPRLAQ